MPGYSPKEKIINKNDSPAPLVPSPVFGLAKINGNFDFTKSTNTKGSPQKDLKISTFTVQ